MERQRLTDQGPNVQVVTQRENLIDPAQNQSTESSGRRSSQHQVSFYNVWPQILASFIALSSVIQPGINLAFSGILIPQLSNDPNIKDFTKDKASWIASLVAISQPVGALFVGPLMDYMGRKKTCIVTTIPIIAGWIITYFTTTSLWPLYIARVLGGFGSGMTTVGLVYTAEVSHVQFRSMLLSLNSVNIALGILITTVLGVYLEWHTAAFYFGVLAVLSFILSFFLPESPYWLANFTNVDIEYTKKQVRYLNRPDWLFEEEWERIKGIASKRREQLENVEIGPETCTDKFKVFLERGCYMPLLLLFILFFLQQSSGTYVVIFYTVNIFKSIGGDFGFGFNEYSATITLGVLRFIMSIFSAIMSKKIGRRPIMIISSIGMGLSCLATAIFLHINNVETINFGGNTTNVTTTYVTNQTISSWWLLVSILSFVCAGAIGHMVIPWTLMSELLPTKIRASGSGLMVSIASLLLFIVIKTFPAFVDLLTLPMTFIVYTVMSFATVIFVQFFLPETFGKNFVEIAKYFEKRRDSIT